MFPDRYHARIIGSRRQARHALAYVLNNWRRHGEDRARRWLVDPFSSGATFAGWRELAHAHVFWPLPATYQAAARVAAAHVAARRKAGGATGSSAPAKNPAYEPGLGDAGPRPTREHAGGCEQRERADQRDPATATGDGHAGRAAP